MKLLITGASGCVGKALSGAAEEAGHEVHAGCYRGFVAHGMPFRIDITDSHYTQKIKDLSPDAIIHCAALSDVDLCERDPMRAVKINIIGTYNVSQANIPVINISTDYVFDGSKGNYKETDMPNPISIYGRTKLFAESVCDTNIRTSCIFGAKDNWLMTSLKRGESVKLASDQFTSPTYDLNLSSMVLEVAERGLNGAYHLAGTDRMSRYEFALKLASWMDLDKPLIQPVKMADISSWTAKRPADSSLNVSKAIIDLNKTPLSIDQVLEG